MSAKQLLEDLRSLIDIDPAQREAAAHELLLNHMDAVHKISSHLWSQFGKLPRLHPSDFDTIAMLQLWTIARRSWEDPTTLDGIENFTQVWAHECYNEARTWVRMETAPASKIGRRNEARGALQRLRWQMYQRDERWPSISEVLQEYNADVQVRRKDAARQGMVLTEIDFVATQGAMSLDASFVAGAVGNVAPDESEFLHLVSEDEAESSSEENLLEARIIDECYLISPETGIIAELVLPRLFSGDTELAIRRELAKRLDIKPVVMTQFVTEVMEVAREVGTEWIRTERSHGEGYGTIRPAATSS